MNNDFAPPRADDALPRASTSDDTSNNEPASATAAEVEQEQIYPAQSRTRKRAEAQFEKKHEFISSLMKNLDVLIYMELCIMYYMDCSLFRFLLRALPQMTFLSPKPAFTTTLPRDFLNAIFGPNILCMLLHIFTARPEANEAMRGYLHGGVIIDLIGFKGPTSKLHLLCLDILVLVLQCVMLTVQTELKMATVVLAAVRSNHGPGSQARVQITATQDHNAEEQGIMRNGIIRNAILNNGGIEIRATSTRIDGPSSHDEPGTDADQDRAQLLEDSTPQDDAQQDNVLGTMWSGSAVIADFNVLSALQRVWSEYSISSTSDSTLDSTGFSTEIAALRANRQLNAATQRIQRGVEALR